ncbi:MAG: hypothetical protein MI924_24285, partial [Chloroflexales bacterium]|nr:hypothetical protein [Chloroflexales bacterium]
GLSEAGRGSSAQEQVAEQAAGSSESADQSDFSFADLGLSDEEIAALGLSEAGRGTDADTPPPSQAPTPPPSQAPTSPEQAPTEEPKPRTLKKDVTADTTPLSLAELGLNSAEIAALSLTESMDTIDFDRLQEELAELGIDTLPPLLQPFKIDETGVQQPSADPDQEAKSKPAQSLFERLRQRRRFLTPLEPLSPPVSLSADDPEMAFFSEDDVSLRDDDDQVAEANLSESGQKSAPSQSTEPSHFSLTELSKIFDEIAAQGLNEAKADQEAMNASTSSLSKLTAAAAASLAAATHDVPDFPIFSIEDLGLTPEELVVLGNVEAVPIVPIKTTSQYRIPVVAVDEQNPSSYPKQDAEYNAATAPPQQEEQHEAEAPKRRSFPSLDVRTNVVFEQLDNTMTDQQAMSDTIRVAPLPAQSEALQTPGREAQRWSPTSFIPTGDTTLDSYLYQLEAEPGNRELALEVAHSSMQLGLVDLAIQQYKHLIRKNQVIDQIIVELQNLIDGVNDQAVLTRLYRMLGDAYSRRGRFRDAIAAYGYTVAPREQ